MTERAKGTSKSLYDAMLPSCFIVFLWLYLIFKSGTNSCTHMCIYTYTIYVSYYGQSILDSPRLWKYCLVTTICFQLCKRHCYCLFQRFPFSIYNVTLCSIWSFQRTLDIIQPNDIFQLYKMFLFWTQINSNAKTML